VQKATQAWLEVSVVLTSTNLLCHLKLASMPVSTGFFEAAGGSMCFNVLSFVSILSNKNLNVTHGKFRYEYSQCMVVPLCTVL